MKLSKYKNYIDLKGNWIDCIPSEWRLDRFTDVFVLNKGLNITKADLTELGIPCVNYGEIHSKYGFELDSKVHKLKFVPTTYLTTNRSSLLKQGDFVFADTSEDIEGTGNFTYLKSDEATFAGYHTIIAKPQKNLNSRYLAYLFSSESFRSQLRSQIKGVKVYSITNRILNSLQILRPSVLEQEQIVEYLDKKVNLVNQKVSLLRKKKTKYNELVKTLICEVITRGVKKDPELMTSEIEWIGELRGDWKIARMKDIYSISKSLVGERSDEFQLLSLTQKGVLCRDIDSGFGKFPAEFNSYQVVKEEDLIFCLFDLDVTPRTVGISPYSGMITGAYTIITPISKIKNKYYYYLFLITDMQKNLSKYYSGLRSTIKKDVFMSLEIPLPSYEEQTEIVDYLDTKIMHINKIIESIDCQITILNKYKKTMINDVVTGKVKVT